MGNDRLRIAMREAGIEVSDLADQAEVDLRTAERWLAGTTPRGRKRTDVARILNRPERDLWPDEIPDVPADNLAREITGAWAHANDLRAPDWRTLLRDAHEHIELLDTTLLPVLSTPGVTDQLAGKAAGGCQVMLMIAAPGSAALAVMARELGLDAEDYVGRSQLERDRERARGYLEPLLSHPGIDAREHHAQPVARILRFDAHMLHLERRYDEGLFDQYLGHLARIREHASSPIAPNPEQYPHPGEHPDYYAPVTEEIYARHVHAARTRHGQASTQDRR